MNRTTLDYGIDLGTTNSAIAVLKGVAAEIIKNNADGDITPSAVSIDKKGALQVGQRARNRIIDAPEDAYMEFKRRMGSDHIYQFKSSGQSRNAEELSAEVLKSLRADVQQRAGELIDAAVITVPAAFELHQCEATRRAAQIAGFTESPLLQEPVAAALAYGFQAEQQKAYWLVYDFGGGTFDAAIIKSEEGTINVVNHGGDNFLGGSDIDWAIVEELLVPRILEQNLLENFKRGNLRWRQAFAKLKRAAETAKIDLSRSDRAVLETCRFEDDTGNEIEFEAEIHRDHVMRVAEPVIRRSLDICKRVLKEKNLEPNAIERVILVGGPTLAPYFRSMLEAGLGIPLDQSVDPLTVVARGAAVFAGTQKLQAAAGAPLTATGFSIDLKYQPVGIDDTPTIGAIVSAAGRTDLAGFAVEIVNQKTQWRSGRIALRPDGVFLTTIHADKGERNSFRIEMYDAAGLKQLTRPDEFHYTIGTVVEEQPLINSLGVALANNQYDHFFEKGSGLPLRAARNFRTIAPLHRGQSGELLRIPLVEGEQDLADRNRKVGELEIRADNILRDLPSNSDIDVTLSISADRIIRITAYVPLLDEHFEGKIDMRSHTVNPGHLKADFEAEMKRFGAAKIKAATTGHKDSGILMEEIERSPLLLEVKQMLESAQADPDAAAKCEKRLLELKLKLDEATNQVEWPVLTTKARKSMSELHRYAQHYGDGGQKERARDLAEDIEDIIREGKANRLRTKIDQVNLLLHEIAATQPDYWVAQFRRMEAQRHKISDQARAALLLQQGKDSIAKNSPIMLQSVVEQLWALLPREELEAAQRGYQSGLIR
ncbi:MAG: Hsp70 family protein [Verrucomicrobiota bacterium]|jgi:molecular chaperone DnaK